MLRKRTSLLLVMVMLLAILAACGDDDDAEDGDAAAADTATPSPTIAPPDILPATPTAEPPSGAELVIPPEIPESVPKEGRALGDPDAPVAVVEYGDFL